MGAQARAAAARAILGGDARDHGHAAAAAGGAGALVAGRGRARVPPAQGLVLPQPAVTGPVL